jgi:hypothetical protein
MAFHNNPRIVQDSLALCLDANATRSYSGSGSTWTDLAQGLSFASQGTQTPLTTAGGAKCFQFNGSGWWRCNSGHTNVDMAGACTLVMWVYPTDLTERDTIFEKAGTTYNSYEQEIAVTYESGENFSWYSRQGTYDYGTTTTMTTNAWNMMAIKMSTGKIAGVNRSGYYSKNGANWTSNYTVRSTNAITTAGEIRVGNGYAGVVESGYIAQVLVYEKEITNSELLTIYNTHRSRFGI